MKLRPDIPDVLYKRSLFSWVWTSNLKLQGFLLAIIVVTVAVRVLPLEMQKKIINQAIGLKRLDLPAHGALRQVQLLGGARDRQVARAGLEGLECCGGRCVAAHQRGPTSCRSVMKA